MKLHILPALLLLLLHVSEAVTTATTTKQKQVVIVGGGVGGLTAAARIASHFRNRNNLNNLNVNVNVTILEKNSNEFVGGRCGSFDVKYLNNSNNNSYFRHERGPSLLLLKDVYEELFLDCSNLADDGMDMDMDMDMEQKKLSAEDFGLFWKQCIPAYKVIFEDGDAVDMGFPASVLDDDDDDDDGNDNVQMMKELYEKSRKKMNDWEASSDGALRWDAYMKATSAFLDCGWPNFIEESLDIQSLPNFLMEAFKDGAKSWPLLPHSAVLDNFFVSNKMKAMASFQDLYVGLEPYTNNREVGGGVLTTTAPAVFGLLAALELHPTNKRAGVFAPIGGFRAVGQAFERLAIAMGVHIEYDKTVTEVRDDGVYFLDSNTNSSRCSAEKFIPADLVLINADLPYATKCILNDSNTPRANNIGTSAPDEIYDWDDKYRYSSGVIAFHWSLNNAYTCLNTHNVFLSASENKDSWKTVRENYKVTSDDPFNFYVHRASATDETAAPKGCDSIMVLVPCATLNRNKEWSKLNREDAIKRYKEQFSDEYVQSIKRKVLERMTVLNGLKDLELHIINEVIDTPGSYADLYNVGAGTPFALVSLYLCGSKYFIIEILFNNNFIL